MRPPTPQRWSEEVTGISAWRLESRFCSIVDRRMSPPVEAHKWRVQLDLDADSAVLSVEEQTRAQRLHFERDSRRFIAARAALRHLVGTSVEVAAAQMQIAPGRRASPFPDSVRELPGAIQPGAL